MSCNIPAIISLAIVIVALKSTGFKFCFLDKNSQLSFAGVFILACFATRALVIDILPLRTAPK